MNAQDVLHVACDALKRDDTVPEADSYPVRHRDASPRDRSVLKSLEEHRAAHPNGPEAICRSLADLFVSIFLDTPQFGATAVNMWELSTEQELLLVCSAVDNAGFRCCFGVSILLPRLVQAWRL